MKKIISFILSLFLASQLFAIYVPHYHSGNLIYISEEKGNTFISMKKDLDIYKNYDTLTDFSFSKNEWNDYVVVSTYHINYTYDKCLHNTSMEYAKIERYATEEEIAKFTKHPFGKTYNLNTDSYVVNSELVVTCVIVIFFVLLALCIIFCFLNEEREIEEQYNFYKERDEFEKLGRY